MIAEGNRAEEGGRLHEACESYRAAVAAAPDYARAHLNLGIGLEALGDADAAIQCYEKALASDQRNAYALYNLGKLLYARGSRDEAEQLLVRALENKAEFPEASLVLADIHDSRGDLVGAAAHLESALRQRPDYAGAAYNYALVLKKLGRAAESESALRRAMALEPGNIEAARLLGDALSEQGKVREAELCYRNALALDPDRPDVLSSLGYVLAAEGELAEAEDLYRTLLASKPDFPDALCNLGNVLHLQGRVDAAAVCYRKAIALDPHVPEAHFNLGNVLKDQGRTKQSMDCYREALSLQPDYAQARWALAMAHIPVVCEDAAEPSRCREAFAGELEQLERWFTAERSARGWGAVGAQQPFYLAYQEEDNSGLLRRYGGLCARLMKAWFDAQKFAPRSLTDRDGVVRVGVVSQYFHDHSVWNAIMKGWFRRLDPQRFSIHAFYLGFRRDDETAFAASRAAHFEQGARGLRQWVEAILGQNLHVLVYPEIGMDATALKLASLRLAPVQAVTWGHPETSGLPTIDYFLSAESFEPRDARANYTERLIALPHIGCSYEPLRIAPIAPDPAAFGIDAGTPMLVCAGTPFKYAPRYDRVLIEIAERLERCRFVFFAHHVADMSEKLRARLDAAFARRGLDPGKFIAFLPWQNPPAFHGWLARADVLLDTIGFSGFNTAVQAVECGLPIVAREGRFLRGRLASGILRRIGLDELVADTEERYVALAVRLCRDGQYRKDVRERIAMNRARLRDDAAVIRATESFLEKAARSDGAIS